MQTSNPETDYNPAWRRTLYIMAFAQVMVAVGFSSIFPFLPLYVEQLGSDYGFSLEFLSGMVYSSQAFMMMLASPVWGAIADRYGRKLMVVRSMYGGTILILLMAFVRSGEELVLVRTIQGLVTGTVAAASALVAAEVPRQRTGYAMGMLQVALGSGVALGPIIGGTLADAFGYAASFYITAFLLFIAGLVVTFGIQEDFTPPTIQAGLRDGFFDEWKHVLSAPGVLIAYGMRFFSQMGRMMIYPFIPLFIKDLLSVSNQLNTFTGLVIGVASFTTTLSAIYLGRLGDRIGHRSILIICLFIAAGLYFPQAWAGAGWHLLVLQALVGIALGGILPMISALLAGFTVSGEEGAVYGLDNSINAGGRAVAPLVGGLVASAFNLRATFIATALVFLLAGGLAIWRLPRSTASQKVQTVQAAD